nr:hypothetical protein [Burkholderiaceae bacterium]
ADRNADRNVDRSSDRNADRMRRSQPRQAEVVDPALQASMAAAEDTVSPDAIVSEPVETMLSVSADVVASLIGEANTDDVIDVAPKPATRRPRRKAGAVAAESVSSAASAVSVPIDAAVSPLMPGPSDGTSAEPLAEPEAAATPARRRRTRKAADAAEVTEAADASAAAKVFDTPVEVTDESGTAMADAGSVPSIQSGDEPREARARTARGRHRGRSAESAPVAASAEVQPHERADAVRDEALDEPSDGPREESHEGSRDGSRDRPREDLRDEQRDEARGDTQSDDRRLQALELVVGMIEALAAERGDGEKIWGSMVKQTLKRRKPGFNESYYGFRSFNRLLEEARDRGLIELDLDDKSGGYTVRSLA